jgi:hypothetical protein
MTTITNKRKISNLERKREDLLEDSTLGQLENEVKKTEETSNQKTKLVDRLEGKITKLSDRKVIAEMKQESYKKWFDISNLLILFLSAILTILEAVKNDTDVERAPVHKRNFFKITPLFISTVIGLITAIIKFKKYQEKLENNTKAIEKSNFTTFRMKKLQEDLHFADQAGFLKIRETYKEEIFPLYNQAQEELEGNLQHKDIIKYASIKKKIENDGNRKLLRLNAEEKRIIEKYTNADLLDGDDEDEEEDGDENAIIEIAN